MRFLNLASVVAITLLVVALTATSVSTLWGEPIAGKRLMGHMTASGGLVVVLPIFGYLGLRSLGSGGAGSGSMARAGLWGLLLSGWLAIATVFLCMLPLAGTDTQRSLIHWHAYAGFAMVPALVCLLAGMAVCRKKATRSANPG